MAIYTKLLSSMTKCFTCDDLAEKKAISSLSMLRNERLSFQFAYKCEEGGYRWGTFVVDGGGIPEEKIKLYRVDAVPVYNTGKCDDYYLEPKSDLYPDILTPVPLDAKVSLSYHPLYTFMVQIEDENGLKPGTYNVTVGFTLGEESYTETLELTVVDAMLPEQSLIHTQWFHNDCIATYYNTDVFSEKHWELIGNYMEAAKNCGVNMILTPVLTPPLDTEIGLERPTVQLVDITVEDGKYSFGFEKLDRYVKLALENGMKYFEISHLFSQWGAIKAPKVVATVDGVEKKIFGWDTDATGEEYRNFIREFITALLAELKALGIDKQCWFHVSDEPSIQHLETYTAAKDLIADVLKGYHLMDALSKYEFYETGACETPIPATNHIEPFLENKVPNLWAYYCCGQGNMVSNRFIAMPGDRTRMLGEQLYKFDIKGFLQWGFNFWYSQNSVVEVNPYTDTSGINWVPAGDTFSVYPGRDGKAVYSLHALHFYEALQDMRALQLLETKLGREAVEKLIDFGCERPMTFKDFPRSEDYLLNLRDIVNRMV